MSCITDTHTLTLVVIIIGIGAFGGYLNYLHNFDTTEDKQQSNRIRNKYVLLGVGSAILVPAFFRMIASDLLRYSRPFDNINYLIFAGFCLVAAIFSRRFITTLGDKILDAAKKAEIASNEAKNESRTTKLELSSTQERIEDVKVAVNLRSAEKQPIASVASNNDSQLLALVDSYIEKTTIPDYSDRLKMKAELGRAMGQIVVRNNLPKDKLFEDHKKEGMYLALVYAIELSPDGNSLALLNKIAKSAQHLYTKYVILVAYRTLASSGFIPEIDAREVANIIESFRAKADRPLIRNIDDTLNVLRFIDRTI
jgi:hypothetical protein